MTTADFRLTPHSAHPPATVTAVQCRVIGRDAYWLTLRWRVEGGATLVLPRFAGRGRTDGLWQATCFELFLKPDGGEGYCEFNLSPSERWAAYDFTGYREGMRERPMPRDPMCTIRAGSSVTIFDAALPVAGLPSGDCAMGISAVIEEEGGAKSFWALAHGGDVPDFHDRTCFAGHLPAPACA